MGLGEGKCGIAEQVGDICFGPMVATGFQRGWSFEFHISKLSWCTRMLTLRSSGRIDSHTDSADYSMLPRRFVSSWNPLRNVFERYHIEQDRNAFSYKHHDANRQWSAM